MSNGRLDIVFGPMYSGKSTYLIHELSRYQKGLKCNVLLITSKTDTREYLTHNNIKSFSPNVKTCYLTSLIETKEFKNATVIGIDEAQFFTDLVEFVHESVEVYNKHIIVCGLMHDFQRNRFGHMMHILGYADNVTHIKALCYCGKDGIFSKRIVKGNSQVMVGANESYIPVCRYHYLN